VMKIWIKKWKIRRVKKMGFYAWALSV
jgi:hypothetical protein